MQPIFARSAVSVLGVALLAACSDGGSGPAGDAQVNLSLATRSAAAANAAVGAGPDDLHRWRRQHPGDRSGAGRASRAGAGERDPSGCRPD